MKSEVRLGENKQKWEAIQESMCIKAEEIKASNSIRVLAVASCGTWLVPWDLEAAL